MKNFQISLSALTIGEFVIGLAIIGVLALILIPIYKTATPNKLDSLHKKATYTVDRIVNELSTDEYLYPSNSEYTGLSNTTGVIYNGELHSGITKFCTLFASRIIRKPGTQITCASNAVSVTSQEGMDWYLPISDFKTGSETILVDVNGSDLPNELGTDRFEYKVKPGLKVEVEEPTFYAPTGAPPSKGTGGGAPSGPDKDNRTAQNVYSIVCGGGGATIYGEGSNKVNGTYTLVAVPNKGYKCNWFIHQVTVKDSDVTDCNLSCSPDNNIPTSDGETIVPPPGDDDDGDDDDDDLCIDITVTGESDQCTVSGAGCGKTKGIYTVSVSSKDPSNYSPEWSSKKYTLVDKSVSDTVSCDKIDPGEACYNIIIKGDTENCPYELTPPNCKREGEATKYTNGTYKLTVSPKEGFFFQDSAEPSSVNLLVSDKDETYEIDCRGTMDNNLAIEFNFVGLGAPPNMQPVVAECSGSVCTIIDDIGGGGTGRFGVFEIKVSGHDEKGVDAEEVPWTAKEGSAPFWNGPFVSGQMNYFSPGGSYTGSKSGVYFDVSLTRSQERCVHYKDYPDKIACISTVADPGSACKIEYKVHKSDDLADVTPLVDVHVTGGVDTVYEYRGFYGVTTYGVPCGEDYFFTPSNATSREGIPVIARVEPREILNMAGQKIVNIYFEKAGDVCPSPATANIKVMPKQHTDTSDTSWYLMGSLTLSQALPVNATVKVNANTDGISWASDVYIPANTTGPIDFYFYPLNGASHPKEMKNITASLGSASPESCINNANFTIDKATGEKERVTIYFDGTSPAGYSAYSLGSSAKVIKGDTFSAAVNDKTKRVEKVDVASGYKTELSIASNRFVSFTADKDYRLIAYPEEDTTEKYVNGTVHMKNGGASQNNNWIVITTFKLSTPAPQNITITINLSGGGSYSYTILKGNTTTTIDPQTVTLPGGADPVTGSSVSDKSYENRIQIINDEPEAPTDNYRDWAIIRSDLIETAEGSQAVWVEYYVSGVVVNSFKRSLIVYGTGDNGCKSQYTLNPGTVPPGTYDGSSYRFRNTAHFSCYCNSFSYELK